MKDARRVVDQRHGVDAVDERLKHLLRITLKFVEQRLQPADVRLGVSVEKEQHRRASGPSAVHPRHHQALPSLVTQQSHFRQKSHVVGQRLLEIDVGTTVVNQYHLRTETN